MAFPVAVIQFTVEPGHLDVNREEALKLVAEASRRGARLILLPEAFASDLYRGAEALAETLPGRTTERFQKVAGDAIVALPLLERSGGRVYSACALVGKDGILGIARKTHLFRDPSGHDTFQDADLLAAGDALGLFDLGEIKVGVLLGFDAEFPEAFRTLALKGADLILAPLNRFSPDLPFLQGMALRNQVPILAANRLGFRRVYPAVPEFSALTLAIIQEKDGTFLQRCKGGSVILDASGKVVAEPGAHAVDEHDGLDGIPAQARIPVAHFQEDEILMASFRIDELRLQRLTSPFLSQRREDLYRT